MSLEEGSKGVGGRIERAGEGCRKKKNNVVRMAR